MKIKIRKKKCIVYNKKRNEAFVRVFGRARVRDTFFGAGTIAKVKISQPNRPYSVYTQELIENLGSKFAKP